MKKRWNLLIGLLLLCVILVAGCSSKEKTIAIVNAGISMEIPNNMVVVYTNQKTFDYNGLRIPSISVDGVSEDQKTVMNIKSFPFSATDYINQYRSAFKGDNISEIKYDYKKLKIKKNGIFAAIYESKAVLETEKGKKESYVYLVSFKEKLGSLVVQFTGNKGKNYRKFIESIVLIKVDETQVKPNEKKQSYDNLKRILLEDGLVIHMPSNYEVKNRISPVTGTYYLNMFGDKNDAIYLCVTEHKPLPLSKNRWSMANAMEIIQVLDEKGSFIVHNINNSHLYYLNSAVKEVKLANGKTVYVRVDYLDKNNDKEFFSQVLNGVGAMK